MSWEPTVVAAIDFGTHGSGFAWAVKSPLNDDPPTRTVNVFTGYQGARADYPKNLTAILVDRQGSLLAWGYQARTRWTQALADGNPDQLGYVYAFKSALTEFGAQPGIPAVSGSLSRAGRAQLRTLVTAYLGELRKTALADITAAGACPESEIRWCLTVPALWDEPAHCALRQAAYDAGFPASPERLLLLAEPEAAALCCQRWLADPAAGPDPDETRFIVVNCGGAMAEYINHAFRAKLIAGRFDAGVMHSPDWADSDIPAAVWAAGIVAEVEEQLVRVRRSAGDGPGRETVVVVGGLAMPAYLREALGRRFGREHRILVPPEPALAALEGAVHYAYNPGVLASRRSPYTYGFALAMPWEAGVDSPSRKFRDADQELMCRDRFAVVVRRLDRVAVDEPVTFLIEPAVTDSPEVTVQLFRTRTADPRYVDEEGCERVCELTVDISDTIGRAERPIALLLYFGRSQIQVEATDLITNKKFEISTDFERML